MRSVHCAHLVLAILGLSLFASEQVFTVLVEAHVRHLDIAGVHWGLSLLTIRLFSDEFLNVDAPFSAVYFSDFALTSFERSTNNFDGVTVADGNAAGKPFSRQVFAQLGRHDLSANGRRSGKVGLAGLSALAGNVYSKEERRIKKKQDRSSNVQLVTEPYRLTMLLTRVGLHLLK